ncbi:MAG: hypothetical protein AB7F59_10760 [Bdellovibrionales bacterium]
MKTKNLFILFVAVAAFAGLSRIYSISKHKTASNTNRVPASIPKMADVSELTGSALETASKRRLLAGAKSILEGENFGVSLGHFITKGMDGRAAFACDVYDRVILTFAAEGIAVSGDRPSLTVETNCEVSQDVSRLATIWIPIQEIKSGKPVDSELKLTQPIDISIKLSNMISEWPAEWVLSKVKLYNRKEGKGIEMDSTNLYQMMSSPISMRW